MEKCSESSLNLPSRVLLASVLSFAACEDHAAEKTVQPTSSVAASKAPEVVISREVAREKPFCRPETVELKGVHITPREKWGAKPANLEVLGSMDNCSNFPIQKITLHHTGDSVTTDVDQEKNRFLSAQAYHQKHKEWGDIAYHYGIGPSGRIYEGRNPAFRGDSSTKYYPNDKGHSHTPENHLLIVMIGNYDKQELTSVTRLSLTKLIAANMHEYGLELSDVNQHKDIAHTGCPGKDVSEWLKGGKGSIRYAYKKWPWK